ncbi:MAG: class I SAM-dependent methyltransferase [Thiothrix sp.]
MSLNKEKSLNVVSRTSMPLMGVKVCRDWYATPAGQAALARVQSVVGRMTADIFGYHALETGVLAGQNTFLQESRIAHQIALGVAAGENGSVVGTPEQLPFAFSNIDLVIASHALDCTGQPHQVLREIERVLVPEGHCILIGFNPFSFKGVGRLRHLHNWDAQPCHFYSTFRVRDWLSVLGFDVRETVSAGFCPVLGGNYLFQRTRWLDHLGEKFHFMTGNVYIIHAQKKVSNMTPLLPARKVKPLLKPGMIVNPGAGRVSRQEPDNAK